MSTCKLDSLSPLCKENAITVINLCQEVNIDLLIYSTLRSLYDQASLYRQSRSWNEIKLKIQKFRNRGFCFLSDIIDEVGPKYGEHVTNAAPGESWHNYAEAWDAVPLINGKPVWIYGKAKQHWDSYGKVINQVGMHWAGNWISWREFPHAQLREGSNPLKVLSPDEINKILTDNKLI